eukprot:4882784-Pyramimonas_sp.AAC.1
MQSGSVGWTRLGDYGFSGGPGEAERPPFASNVAGRPWSGLESGALDPRELRRLVSSLARKLRAMMRAAHYLDGQDAHSSFTTT